MFTESKMKPEDSIRLYRALDAVANGAKPLEALQHSRGLLEELAEQNEADKERVREEHDEPCSRGACSCSRPNVVLRQSQTREDFANWEELCISCGAVVGKLIPREAELTS